MSSKPTGPDRGGIAGPEQSVFAAMACQSVTASALAAFDQPSAPRRPAATHLFQFKGVVTCISFLPVWVERLRFTLRHEENDRASRHGGRRAARERGVERAYGPWRSPADECASRCSNCSCMWRLQFHL